ncbi:hypothetical protein Tco_0179493 [Tanacetum coccineum]
MNEADLMPRVAIVSLSRFEAEESDGDDTLSVHKEEFSKSDEVDANKVLDELVDMTKSKNDDLNTSADKSSLLVADALQKQISNLLSDTLKNILPQIIKDSVNQALPNSSSSEFSPIPPLKVADKGKGIATEEEPLKQLIPLMEQGGSDPKMLNLQQFNISGKKMTLDDAKAQIVERKRLLAAYEAKRAKMLKEYNHYITFRADLLPITKISYRIDNSTKQASMRITRNNQPLNLTVYDNGSRKLGISPLPELTAFGLSTSEKKRKRNSDIIKEVFVIEDIVVDEIFFYNGNFDLVFQREEEFHLATTARLIRTQSAIQKGTLKVEEMFKKMELAIKTRNDVAEARKIVKENLDGMGQYMRIQVRDIIKEVKDYLKTYSSVGMDISWVIPTHCQCNKPLVRRVAWTDINPCRRFLNYRNSNIAGTTYCNSFYWIDPELTNPWYKTQIFEMYLTLNPKERHLYHNQITAQNQLENLQNEFEVYHHDM